MADWYVLDAHKNPQGPLSTPDVLAQITAGTMTHTTSVNRAGTAEWKPVQAWPEFQPAPAPTARRAAQTWLPAIASGVVCLAVGFGLGRTTAPAPVVVVKEKSEPTDPAPATSDKVLPATNAPAPTATPQPTSNMFADLMAIEELPKAVEFLKPHMADSRNELDRGSMLLTAWNAQHLKLKMVKVAIDETTIPLVLKDSDETRGKKMCMSGSIIQIEVEKPDSFKFADGLLMTDDTSLIEYTAVGSTGSIVKNSSARICGIVTGVYHYNNSGGGVGHAVKIIGMFDLPENK